MRVLAVETRPLRRRMRPDSLVVGAWLSALAIAEVLGRRSTSDGSDGAGVLGFLLLAALTWRAHQSRPLAIVRALTDRAHRLVARLAAYNLETGVDLRVDPPLPRGFPPVFRRLLLGTVAATALVALAHGLFPTDVRSAVRSVSCAVWLLGLTAFWSLLGSAALLLFALPIAFMDDALEHSARFQGRRRFALEAVAITAHLAVLVVGILFAPAWVPLALLVVTFGATAALALLPGRPALSILWRADRDSPPRVMEWTSLALTNLAILACLIAGAYLMARGDRLFGDGAEETAITSLLGAVFGWTASTAYAILMVGIPFTVLAGRFRNPALRRAGRVHLAGDPPAELVRTLRARLAEADLELVSRKAGPRRGDVRLAYRPEGHGTPLEWQSEWPLVVGEVDLAEGEVGLRALVERARRRDEILRRRQLLHGLERLFKWVARRRYSAGNGFWLAPHHWFITRLGRDVDESDAWFGGPSYHPTLPIRARAHFHEIMRGCELDVIFVEDGVGFRRLKRVLAMLFEYHDLFGGERRAEERHFSGLPGVRVLIHEYDLGREYPYSKYPEPDYEDLGRARILHVFKDRGEEETTHDVPRVPDFVPEPMLSS